MIFQAKTQANFVSVELGPRGSSLLVCLWSSGGCDAEEESSGEAPGQVDVVRGKVHEPLEAAPVKVRVVIFRRQKLSHTG